VSVVFDVTDLRTAEDELRRVHDRYRLLVDSLDELVALKDPSGRILLVNQAYADWIGLPKDAIEGATREEFFPDPALAELEKRRHDEAVSTGESGEFETEREVDGDPRIYRSRETPILDSEGRVDSVASISADVTEQRSAEDALKLSGANNRALIENMDAIVGLKDVDGRYVVVNKAFCAVVGLPQEDIIGKMAKELFDDPVLVSVIESQDREVLETRRPLRLEVDDGDENIVNKAPILDGMETSPVSYSSGWTSPTSERRRRSCGGSTRRTGSSWTVSLNSSRSRIHLAGSCSSTRPLPTLWGGPKRT
jgi:PAS domain S-box-containing protein